MSDVPKFLLTFKIRKANRVSKNDLNRRLPTFSQVSGAKDYFETKRKVIFAGTLVKQL